MAFMSQRQVSKLEVSKQFKSALQALTDCYHQAQPLVVLTGAGVSQESGILTFRDAQTGLWANYKPEDLATREGFLANPAMVWNWYDHRRNGLWNAQPNAAHLALAQLEAHFTDFTLITQNIDGLHQRAGSQNVLELHGNVFRYKCLEHNHPVSLETLENPQATPPQCPRCNSLVRPDVVWFGEFLPDPIIQRAFQAAKKAWVMLIIGTSGVVQPAASLPLVAKESGATIVEINTEPSALTAWMVDVCLQGRAAEQLSRLLQAFQTALEETCQVNLVGGQAGE